MTERTVTVQTSDHGPVTIPEPAWCLGEGHDLDGDFRASIGHFGADVPIEVRAPGGTRELITVALAESPFATDPADRGPHIVVQLLDGAYAFDAAGLDNLARDLVEAASELRHTVRRLQVDAGLGGGR